MDLPDAPLPKEGILVTHYLTVADQTVSRAFYEGVLGGKVVAAARPHHDQAGKLLDHSQ